MKDAELLNLLEEAVRKLAFKLDYDDLKKGEINTHGGAFILRGKTRIVVHKHLSLGEKIDVLTGILSEVDTESEHLPAAVRERLEKAAL